MSIDFDPVSATAARQAVDQGVYGTPRHRQIEEHLRYGVPLPVSRPKETALLAAIAQYGVAVRNENRDPILWQSEQAHERLVRMVVELELDA